MNTPISTLLLCLSLLAAKSFGADPKPTKFEDLPNELLYDALEYLDYDGWLAINESLGKMGVRMQDASVSKMQILPEHAGKPIPPKVASVCAVITDSDQETQRIVSRLADVLREATGIKSISLRHIPIDSHLLGLMCRHAESLEHLSLKLGINSHSSGVHRGWIRRFTKLRALKFQETDQANIAFPADFEPLKSLVSLDFCAFNSLRADAFQHLGGLRYLKLNVDTIAPPENRVFSPLVNLRMLDLEKQDIQLFDVNTLRGLDKLERIVLPYTIMDFATGAFSLLKSLASVNCEKGGHTLVKKVAQELEPLGFVMNKKTYEFIKCKPADK